jgi:uncharacterized protein Yka (UPF0111/DUF47 family)
MKKQKPDYFACLARQAALAVGAAEELLRVLEHYDFFALPQAVTRGEEAALAGAQLRREVTDAALEDFLPPLERADLVMIAAGFAETVRGVAAVLQLLFACQLAAGELPPALAELARVILAQTQALHRFASRLGGLKKNATALLAHAWQAEALQTELEACYAQGLAWLLARVADPKGLAARSLLLCRLRACGRDCARFATRLAAAAAGNC